MGREGDKHNEKAYLQADSVFAAREVSQRVFACIHHFLCSRLVASLAASASECTLVEHKRHGGTYSLGNGGPNLGLRPWHAGLKDKNRRLHHVLIAGLERVAWPRGEFACCRHLGTSGHLGVIARACGLRKLAMGEGGFGKGGGFGDKGKAKGKGKAGDVWRLPIPPLEVRSEVVAEQ